MGKINKSATSTNRRDTSADLLRHKLKSPLTTVSLYTDALLSGNAGKISQKQEEYLREIQKASKKMIALVKHLLK